MISMPNNTVLMREPSSLAEAIGKAHGQCYRHHYPDGRCLIWSIDVMLQIIGDREPVLHITLEQAREALRRNSCAAELDHDYAMQRDLSIPIIAIRSPFEVHPDHIVMLIVDGWHRLLGMSLRNHTEPLPVHFLTREEEIGARIVMI